MILFRSIIISEGTTLDIESLTIIENSIAAAEKFQRDNMYRDGMRMYSTILDLWI
jgi:hypothetical protein